MLEPQVLLQERYQIVGVVGRGGMGTVYEAVDRRLGITVAVKQRNSEERFHHLFEREARLLAALRHPALPRVMDHFVVPEGQFLVMEFVLGDDLATILALERQPFAVEQVLRWGDQLMDVLAYLHSQQPPVIHRDIKPQNLKLSSAGEIMLLDFGLARGAPVLGGSNIGFTLHYAPPEQIHGEATGPRSDFYAAAATFHELLTATRAPDAVRREMALARGEGDPLRLAHELRPEVPVALSRLLLQGLALAPSARPASAAEFRTMLRAARSQMQTAGAGGLVTSTPDAIDVAPESDTGAAILPQTAPSTATLTLLWIGLTPDLLEDPVGADAVAVSIRRRVGDQAGQIVADDGLTYGAVFATASAALRAALAIQDALGRVPSAMALHTGAVQLRGGALFGPARGYVARLLKTAHPGQVLLSSVTGDLARDALPPDATLRDLGLHRLQDLGHPERLLLLDRPGFRPGQSQPRTLDTWLHNLPVQATPLIGREEELAAATAYLRDDAVRLLTFLGPGGVGKTRLALQAAADAIDHFADGVFMVPLASLGMPDMVITAIAQTLGLREEGDRPIREVVTDYLRPRMTLLLLDNFEHIIAAAPLIGDLLAAAPGLRIAVTSREALHLSGEHALPVAPLGLPPQGHSPAGEDLVASVARYPAVALFLARARAARPDLTLTPERARAIVEICRRLDGLPLAIELAAARCRIFSPQALLARLTRRLAMLTGGPRDRTPRQQTMYSAIDWSYQLLEPGEQALFCRLAVFANDWNLEAAEAVCDAPLPLPVPVLEGLESLVAKSLVRQEDQLGDEPSFKMLETIREFALERLVEQGEAESLREAHARYYLDLAEAAEPQLQGPAHGEWLERLEAQHDNLRVALQRSIERRWAETAGRLAAALWRFWFDRGYLSEGRKLLDEALRAQQISGSVRARALNGAGVLAWAQNDYQHAEACYAESLALLRTSDDRGLYARVLNNLGMLYHDRGELDQALAAYEASTAIFEQLDDIGNLNRALNNMAIIAHDHGDKARARELFEAILKLERQRADSQGIADTASNLAYLLLEVDELGPAQALLEESLAILREIDDVGGVAHALSNLGHAARRQGSLSRALALYLESLELFEALCDRGGVAECLEALAEVALRLHQPARAARLLGAVEHLRANITAPRSPTRAAAHEQLLATIRAGLAAPALAAAWEAGTAMTYDQILTFARSAGAETVVLAD